MTHNLNKQSTFIQKQLLKWILPIATAAGLFALIFNRTDIALSIVLGISCSYLSLRNLMLSQQLILQKKNKKAFFLPMLIRLGIITIPITLAMMYKDYLNLFVLLLCLLAFQMSLIVFEIVKNLKQIRKR